MTNRLTLTENLSCGATRERITPPPELLPRLYGLMMQEPGGVNDDLYLRVLVLSSRGEAAMLVSFDLDKAPYPKEWAAELAERYGLPEKSIVYSAIHTHTAPLTDPRPFDGPNAKSKKPPEQQAAANEYEDFIHDALLRAADRAVSGMEPALLGTGTGESYINVNRNIPRGEVFTLGHNGAGDCDRTVFVMEIARADGTPVAFLENYAVHNVVMFRNRLFDGKMGVSADMGGNVSKLLESRFPDATALWTSGAAGDVNPVMMNALYYPDPENGQDADELLPGDPNALLRVMVGRHYADVLTALERVVCKDDAPVIRTAERWIRTPGLDGDYELHVRGVRIGNTVVLGFSGELYTSYLRQIQPLSPFEHTVVINHDGSFLCNSGYILDDEALAKKALGARQSNLRPGYLKAALAKTVGELFTELE